MAESFDQIVIGGGPGGYVAAIRDAEAPTAAAQSLRGALGGIGEAAPGG